MSIPLKLISPGGFQHYDCSGCGDCCRGRFAIIISQADRDRIAAQEWTDAELGLRGKPLFTRQGTDGYQLAHRPDGACVFLGDDNLCRIHARYGEAAKPLACRLYPFTFVTLGNQVRVDVRFDCPATASDRGRPIAAHHPDLLKLVHDVVPREAASAPPPPLYDDVQLTWEQLSRITQTCEKILLDVSLDLPRRITACINLVDALSHPGIDVLNGRKLGTFLDALTAEVQEVAVYDLLERVPPQKAERVAFRQLLGLYGRIDQVGGKAQPWRRLNVSLRMVAGKGAVPPIRDGFPSVSFDDIENMHCAPSGEAAQAIKRYLHTHLSSMGFFGRSFYQRSYLDGLSSLLLTYPLICWYARAFALAADLPQPDLDCVQRALMVVDHQHGVTPLLNIPTERTRTNLLCERSVLRSLTLWYGS